MGELFIAKNLKQIQKFYPKMYFYPCPLWERGSTDGHFIILLFLFQTSKCLFLLGTENTMWGRGTFTVMRSCLKPKTVVIWVKLTLFNGATLNGREWGQQQYMSTILHAVKLIFFFNNQFYLKIHIPTENVYFLDIIKGLPQLAHTIFSSKLNEKYELTSKKFLQLLVKVWASFL